MTDQYPQALREYEKALRANKNVTEPIVGISGLYKRYGRFRDAIEKLEKATELEPFSTRSITSSWRRRYGMRASRRRRSRRRSGP